MEGYSMKKILLSLSIAVILLSNFQQSFAMKQDEDIKITEKIITEKNNKKRDRDEFTEEKEIKEEKIVKQKCKIKKRKKNAQPIMQTIEDKGAFIFEKLSDLPSNIEKLKYTDLNLDFVLGDTLNKKIEEHNKLEKLLTNNIVDNILNIQLDKPFVPTKEELEKIGKTKKENDFPAPDKEIQDLTFGKKLWAFAKDNVREKYVSRGIYEKYLLSLNKYYLSQTLAGPNGHTGSIDCIAILPNGNIVTGSWDHTAKIWNPANGVCLQTLTGHTGWIRCIAVLPNGNIVTGAWDNTAKIWNTTTGNCIQTLAGPNGHTGSIDCIAILPNGNIVTGSWDNTAKIWNTTTGNLLQTLAGPNGHTKGIECIVVLPNGNIVTGSSDNTAKIWNPTNGACLQTLTGHTDYIRCIAVLPNGNIVTGSDDNTAKIWNTTTGNCIQTLAGPNGHTKGIRGIAVLPNGNIVTGAWDNTAKIWNTTTGNCIQTLAGQNGHTGSIDCIAVLPNGNIVTGSVDNTAKIWDSNGNFIQTLAGHTSLINCIAILPNGNIITGSWDKTAKIWDPKIPFIPNVMSMALVSKLTDLKKNNQTIKLHQEWQDIFDKLPVSKDIKDDLKTVLA
jgi:WD40 repeat protein